MKYIENLEQILSAQAFLLCDSEHYFSPIDRVGTKLKCSRCSIVVLDMINGDFDVERAIQCPKAPPQDAPGGEYAKADSE